MFYIDCTVAFVSCALKAVYMPAVVCVNEWVNWMWFQWRLRACRSI